MAITNGYATLAELKARVGLAADDTADDSVLEAVIEAASRAIDAWTDRQFYATASTARYFTTDDPDGLFIDDAVTVTAVATLTTNAAGTRTYGNAWSSTDYDLEPYNTTPYTRISRNPAGLYSFPTEPKGVKITGTWGYSATTPDAVNEACLIQASRLFKRKDAPFGVAGTPEAGQMMLPRMDPDVRALLQTYRRVAAF